MTVWNIINLNLNVIISLASNCLWCVFISYLIPIQLSVVLFVVIFTLQIHFYCSIFATEIFIFDALYTWTLYNMFELISLHSFIWQIGLQTLITTWLNSTYSIQFLWSLNCVLSTMLWLYNVEYWWHCDRYDCKPCSIYSAFFFLTA